MNQKVMVGMSGGVDSSVAALLLLQQGYEVVGITFKLWDEPAGACGKSCCSLSDVNDAREVCQKLGIPHYVLNYKELFRTEVIEYFIREYENGATPNPCIACNRHIKFARFLAHANAMGFDQIATGHYSIIRYEEATGRHLLKRGKSLPKDQSYVLYPLTQDQLARTLMPLGAYDKETVRRIARENGLGTSQKPDSQDICFVPDGDYMAFIRSYTGKEAPLGRFVDTQGNDLGPSKGVYAYTVGQRKGLGISLGRPAFVSALDPVEGTVTLTFSEMDLLATRMLVRDCNFISMANLTGPTEAQVKIRYAHQPAKAVIRPFANANGMEDGVEVLFAEPQRAITPGQAAVFYDGDTVIGGGRIERALL